MEFYCDFLVDFHENMLFSCRGTGRQTTETDRQTERERPALQIYEETCQSWCAHFLRFCYKRASEVCNDLLTLFPPPPLPPRHFEFLRGGGGVFIWVQLFLSYICFPSFTDIPFSSVVYFKLMIAFEGYH
jgi:hypothetical protein